MKIYYGIENNVIDITEKCINDLCQNDIISIPHSDAHRSFIFGDPAFGMLKNIYVQIDDEIYTLDNEHTITINIKDNTITIGMKAFNKAYQDLLEIHSKLTIIDGTMSDELPEQIMSMFYLTGSEKVLEIGGNIGRNSLIIASILNAKGNYNLVTLESDPNTAHTLMKNKNANKLDFYIEPSALSAKN